MQLKIWYFLRCQLRHDNLVILPFLCMYIHYFFILVILGSFLFGFRDYTQVFKKSFIEFFYPFKLA